MEWLPVLAVADILITVAIVREYRLLRRQRLGVTSGAYPSGSSR